MVKLIKADFDGQVMQFNDSGWFNATIAADDMSLLAHSQDSLAVEGSASTTRDGQGSNATTLSAAFSSDTASSVPRREAWGR